VSLNVAVAMGYVPPDTAAAGHTGLTELRGKRLGMIVFEAAIRTSAL